MAGGWLVAGNFNKANLQKVLPKYHQHLNFPTQGENFLDHIYIPYGNAYKAHSCSAFGKLDHALVLLLPAYRQRLKHKQTVMCTVQCWMGQSDSALHHCFHTMDWDIFWIADNNINDYTKYVTGYIIKCINDFVLQFTVQTYPDQKPWINGEVCSVLRAWTAAFHSRDQVSTGSQVQA